MPSTTPPPPPSAISRPTSSGSKSKVPWQHFRGSFQGFRGIQLITHLHFHYQAALNWRSGVSSNIPPGGAAWGYGRSGWIYRLADRGQAGCAGNYLTRLLSLRPYTNTSLYSSVIDYYRDTSDHLVPIDDTDPEVLQINIFEIEDDGGIYANNSSCFEIDPVDYIRMKVLALPRYCQKRKGTTDRMRVNDGVNMRDGREDRKCNSSVIGNEMWFESGNVTGLWQLSQVFKVATFIATICATSAKRSVSAEGGTISWAYCTYNLSIRHRIQLARIGITE
jgi:hypothetical protein